MKAEEYAKIELIEGLKLIGSDYAIQSSLLPDFVHLPDEILNAVTIDQLDFLVENKIFTIEQAKKIKEFDDFLETISLPREYDDMIESMKSGKDFANARVKAKELLKYLGIEYSTPNLSHITYVG